MTNTLTLPPAMAERAQEMAARRDMDVDAFLLQAIAEYLEEQEDIADAKEELRRVRAGEVQTHSWEALRAELLADAED